ncbi:hypothetical protein [Jeotgalibacillus haloalkalitolerans]|uniref:HK97 gp10 family phage protein n=1 Tax=Jeotgalibacillus haloalkalitolerans TaxID=3104292 RepID=A0ABU5KM45_9BACL|nr:hypothetical protein [Jeotgalibacillus sp. HH7-29]MDZ5712240.1 hypothetical protein [Jeotgalibacillus sp. HH7-29]
MSVQFDLSEFEELNKKIQKLGPKAEDALNESLHKHTKRILEPQITKLIKVSRRDGVVRDKDHARNMRWSTQVKENLEVTIKPKGGAASNPGSFGYLAFPDLGIGNHNRVPQEFMSRGRDKALPGLVELLDADLLKAIEEGLK